MSLFACSAEQRGTATMHASPTNHRRAPRSQLGAILRDNPNSLPSRAGRLRTILHRQDADRPILLYPHPLPESNATTNHIRSRRRAGVIPGSAHISLPIYHDIVILSDDLPPASCSPIGRLQVVHPHGFPGKVLMAVDFGHASLSAITTLLPRCFRHALPFFTVRPAL